MWKIIRGFTQKKIETTSVHLGAHCSGCNPDATRRRLLTALWWESEKESPRNSSELGWIEKPMCCFETPEVLIRSLCLNPCPGHETLLYCKRLYYRRHRARGETKWLISGSSDPRRRSSQMQPTFVTCEYEVQFCAELHRLLYDLIWKEKRDTVLLNPSRSPVVQCSVHFLKIYESVSWQKSFSNQHIKDVIFPFVTETWQLPNAEAGFQWTNGVTEKPDIYWNLSKGQVQKATSILAIRQ